MRVTTAEKGPRTPRLLFWPYPIDVPPHLEDQWREVKVAAMTVNPEATRFIGHDGAGSFYFVAEGSPVAVIVNANDRERERDQAAQDAIAQSACDRANVSGAGMTDDDIQDMVDDLNALNGMAG
jgi:hypothetical protein